jgi:FkbM family methyltransferase
MPESSTFSSRHLSRTEWLRLLLRFAMARGQGPATAARLFYHLALKPSLVFRGRGKFDRARILSFRVRAENGKSLIAHARDNGNDVGTFEEFFSSRYTIVPPDLEPIQPKVVYDIGANIGIASLYFSSVFPGARFYGFEPVPQNYEVCRLNYENLPGSEVFPWAVGERSGSAKFEFAENDLRGGGLHGAQTIGDDLSKKAIDVQVYSIADLIKERKLPRPDLLKIDVEGAELEVLKGIGNEGASIRRMLIETHGEQVRLDCMRWIADHGFIVLHIHSIPGGFSSIWCDRVE